jgi:putative acetyltransferase
MIKVKRVNPAQLEVIRLIQELDEYQESMYPPESNHLDRIDELSKSNVIFLAAYIDTEICGIGSVKLVGDYGELKRLYVPKTYRGKGIAKALIKELERYLFLNSIGIARLETGIHQHEAIGLYKRLGYSKVAPFGDYAEDPLSVFMEKKLRCP